MRACVRVTCEVHNLRQRPADKPIDKLSVHRYARAYGTLFVPSRLDVVVVVACKLR